MLSDEASTGPRALDSDGEKTELDQVMAGFEEIRLPADGKDKIRSLLETGDFDGADKKLYAYEVDDFGPNADRIRALRRRLIDLMEAIEKHCKAPVVSAGPNSSSKSTSTFHSIPEDSDWNRKLSF